MTESDKQIIAEINIKHVETSYSCEPIYPAQELVAHFDRHELLRIVDSQSSEIERLKESHEEFLTSIGFVPHPEKGDIK